MSVVRHFYASIIARRRLPGGKRSHCAESRGLPARPLGAAPRALLLATVLAFGASGAAQAQGSEIVELGSSVEALRLFGAGGASSQSMLLADVGLLGLALPQWQAEFDELVFDAGKDKPLLVLVTAAHAGPWQPVISVSQGPAGAELRHPFRLRLLAGSARQVGPASPVVAVALLPAQFDLRRPIHVRWGGAAATITFRR